MACLCSIRRVFDERAAGAISVEYDNQRALALENASPWHSGSTRRRIDDVLGHRGAVTGTKSPAPRLTHGELLLNQNVTIKSAGSHAIAISGDGLSRVFEVAPGVQVSLSNLSLTDGNGVASPTSSSPLDGSGGAILFDAGGTLTVNNCTFTGNQCLGGGGAIEDLGHTLTVTNSSFVGNTAFFGGAIDTEDFTGTLSVTGSTFVNNQAPSNGGALSLGTTTFVADCTFLGNGTQFVGGAIDNFFDPLTVSNCSFRDNSAATASAAPRLLSGYAPRPAPTPGTPTGTARPAKALP
jgi:hypothetical protein